MGKQNPCNFVLRCAILKRKQKGEKERITDRTSEKKKKEGRQKRGPGKKGVESKTEVGKQKDVGLFVVKKERRTLGTRSWGKKNGD